MEVVRVTGSIPSTLGVNSLSPREPASASQIRAKQEEPIPIEKQNLLAQQNAKTKLFNNGSVPIQGLFEVILVDKNEDGRVDAGDAIPEYVKLVAEAQKSKKDEDISGKLVNKVV